MFRKSTVLLIGALAMLQGCSSTPEVPLSAQTYFRGLVRAVDNQLQIRSCFDRQWLSPGTLDENLRTRILERLAGSPLGVSTYLEAWGEPGQPLQELQMLGGDITTCRHQLSGIQIRAGGLNPVWYADIRPGELEVHDSTRLKSWRLSAPKLSRSSTRWVWQGENLSLTIRREACVDPVGIEYALSAQFSSGATQLTGCARYGDLQRVLLKSRYYSRDSSRERQIGLQLFGSERFQLSLISQGGERDSYEGRWRLLRQGELLLQLEDKRLRGAGGSLRFVPQGKLFALANSHPVVGSELLLYPGTEPLLAANRLSGAIP